MFDHKEVELLEKILDESRETNYLLHRLVRELHAHPLSRSAAVQFSGDTPMANNVLVLNVGQTSTATPITFLADGVTPAGATISAATYTFSDPSATVVSTDGVTAIVTGVAPSSAPVTGSVSFTATDTDSAVSKWTVPFTISVNALPPPAQLSQSAAVQFSAPTP